MKTKIKKEPFPIYPIEAWSVKKYGVKLHIDKNPRAYWQDGMSLDVEDDEQGNFVGLGVYLPNTNECYYITEARYLKDAILPKFIAHNGVSDLRKLQKWGFHVTENHLLWDTQLMGHILDSSRKAYGLKKLVKEDLGIEYPSYEDIVGKRTEKQTKPRITLDKQPLELVANYNGMDCYSAYQLYQNQKLEIQIREPLTDLFENYHNQLELPASFVFDRMSKTGIRIDLTYLKQLKETLEAQKTPIEQAILNELGSINLNSTQQLLKAFAQKGIYPVKYKKPSTDKKDSNLFTKYGHFEVVKNYAKWNEINTLLSNFCDSYLERNEEILHPEFKQTGTRTGRPACANPNLLQIPKRTENGKLVRKMFIARDGCMFGRADYKEGEPRLLAHLSKDKDMCALFNAGKGFHSYFADKLNIDREKAKIFDLETYYRATKYGVAKHLNCSLSEAQKNIDMAWNLFPGLYDWENKIIYEAKKNGYITTLLGRRIKVEGLDSNNSWQKEAAERQVMNNLAQASLQEVTKTAMIQLDKENITLLLQVYDDVLIEEAEEIIEEQMSKTCSIMENCIKLDVPMLVDCGIGKNWGDCA